MQHRRTEVTHCFLYTDKRALGPRSAQSCSVSSGVKPATRAFGCSPHSRSHADILAGLNYLFPSRGAGLWAPMRPERAEQRDAPSSREAEDSPSLRSRRGATISRAAL
ncbi:hypothetical protein NDU88_005447 [Pleurodeles waltl]|uniref:Uncharacterized protein n=1 Tax=Pleurodeles waltl TaxID=8319 RepID=A0AAV7VMN9_PLEWA|nr:hypothetical protein NDU88_005447 [Pleurodeles waltl]